jgi:hypothetical protein
VLEEVLLSHHDTGVCHEVVEQGELLGGQVETIALASRHEPGRIQLQRPNLDHRVALGVPTDESANPRRQLGEGEGLDQVVVRSGVEAGDTVVHVVASCQHQDLGSVAFECGQFPGHQVTTQLQTRSVGQIPIEHEDVVSG